ncbi:MAG: MCE family protein [Actinomycetota bacterium]
MKYRFSRGTLVKVVVFTVASAVLTVALAFRIANVSVSSLFRTHNTLEAEFENATGVFAGDAVKLAGVDVGRVTGTEIENGRAIVTFKVDEEVPLTTTSRVGIRWRNVIGLRFLYVYPGEGGQPLENGDRIPMSRTDSAGDIGALLNRLGPILQAIDPAKANAFLDAMNTALAGNEAVVRALLTQGAGLAGDLGDLDEEIEILLSSSDQILGAYAGQNENIGRIIDDLDVLGGELAGMTDTVNSLVENFAVVQGELNRLLRENRSVIDEDVRFLDSVLSNLARNRNRLSRTLCSLPPGILPYDKTSSWGEWFNVRIVEFVVKDEEGAIIASAGELDEQRGDEGPPSFDCPGGTPDVVDVPDDADLGGVSQPAGGAAPVGLQGWMNGLFGESA